MKAIILAAGMGTRLGKYTINIPKAMLEFNGKTLLQTQIDTLRACGIRNIIVVRGYKPDKIDIKDVTYYFNKNYADTNMVETLMCAEEEMNEDILVCYSDILYERRLLEEIKSSKMDIGVTADKDYWDYWKLRLHNPESDVESLVIDREGKIAELGRSNCDLEDAKFRYVGLIKFSKRGIKILKKVYYENKKKYYSSDEPWMDSKSFRNAYMTSLLNAIIKNGHRVDPIIISHGWLEFDTVEDYQKAIIWLENGLIKQFYNPAN